MRTTEYFRQARRAGAFAPERHGAPRQWIRDGRVVSLHYTLSLDDGTIVEAHDRGDPPFLYLHGAGNIVPGLEAKLTHCRAGDAVRISVPPEFGYGRLRPELIKRIPRTEFPAHVRLERGMRFGSFVDRGTVLPAWIADLDGDGVTISFQHPLAGETLHFSVLVLGVRDAHAEELSHGHPHGPGGVQH